jgi:hypothetical protein
MGKSTLAQVVADMLGCVQIDGDDYIGKRGVYVAALRVEELRSKIKIGLGVAPRVLLHCVCARAVVTRLGLVAAAYVYVQRNRAAGGTYSDDHYNAWCAEDGGFEAHNRGYLNELECEVLSYHAEYRPSAKCDIFYVWTEHE